MSPHPSVELRTNKLAKDYKMLSKFIMLLIQSPPELRQSHLFTITVELDKSSILSVKHEKNRPLKYVVPNIANNT